jgi:NAD(P)-dependent dehydrogenase (short-subunit alcohol dehydrogenase family)
VDWIDLSGQTAVVTGAAGGIGYGIAQGLAAVGARVILVDRDEGASRAAAERVGGPALGMGCDLAAAAQISSLAQRVSDTAGPADILVNCAALLEPGPLDQLPLSAWEHMLSINLTGYFLCAQAFGARMLEKGRGSLVHIASIAAGAPQGFSGAYSVGKAGVAMLSRQLAVEWGPLGVRSNVVSPGLIETPMTRAIYESPGVRDARQALVPRRRIGRPGDIADAVVFLASSRADYVTGAEIVVDGGFTQTVMETVPRPGFQRAAGH